MSLDESVPHGVDRWAELGVLVGPFLHEFTNELNVIALETKILANGLAQEQRPSLDVIARALARATECIDQLRAQREPLESLHETIDVAGLLRAVLRQLQRRDAQLPETSLVATHAAIPAPMSAAIKSPFEFRQLVGFLVRLTLQRAGSRRGELSIHLADSADRITLRLRVGAVSTGPEGTEMFQLTPFVAPPDRLQQALGESIARRGGYTLTDRLDDEACELRLEIPKSGPRAN